MTAAPQPVGPELAPQIERLRYEFTLPAAQTAHTLLDLGRVGEISELWINGEALCVRIGSPYRYDISGKLDQPENSLTVEVIPNQVYARLDGFSTFLPVVPPGLDGLPSLCSYND